MLAPYDARHATILSADASLYGLEAVLRQRQPDESLRPIAYASRALTETEQRYTQIEKEAIAVMWAFEQFYRIISLEHNSESKQTAILWCPFSHPKFLLQYQLGCNNSDFGS